jgi:hypothetical protein
MRFIDSKVPGHKANPEKQHVGASAVNSLQEAFNRAQGSKAKGAL